MAQQQQPITYPLDEIQNSVIHEYLDLMRNTETPPIFHVWSLISAASACLGRRCWFQLGSIKIMPNQYIALVGSPGVRKTTSINFIRDALSDVKGMRFAPDNTGGKLQGLVSAMIGVEKHQAENDVADTVDNLAEHLAGSFGLDMLEDANMNDFDRHSMYVCEGELSDFFGIKSNDFINFLTKMWDLAGAKEYSYQLKRDSMVLTNPCLNLIGAITPMHFATYLPAEAIGQGFTSRVILVFSDERRCIPWPEPLDTKRMGAFRTLLATTFEQREGEFTYTPEAKQRIIDLHMKGYTQVEDARFIHYMQRRQVHMVKTAMALCALRLSQEITVQDINDAHNLLAMTELRMSESLGDYGLSPVALAKVRILDMLKGAKEPYTARRLCAIVGGDIRQSDVMSALYDLEGREQIVDVLVSDAYGQTRTAYAMPRKLFSKNNSGMVEVSYALDVDSSKNKARPAQPTKEITQTTSNPEPTPAPAPQVDTPPTTSATNRPADEDVLARMETLREERANKPKPTREGLLAMAQKYSRKNKEQAND